MSATDLVGDLQGRDLIWLTVLGNVLSGPVVLGVVVSRLEDLVLNELNGSPRNIARTLHEMQRGGHIMLTNDGLRWRVSMGPRGRESFTRLMQSRPLPHAPSLDGLAQRIRAGFAHIASPLAV